MGERPFVYNCFSFNNELDILEMRFKELFDVVDRFVISEGNMTFGGKPKPYHFRDNLKRFGKYLSKVTHFLVDDWPNLNPWTMEHFQRDRCMRGLSHCKDNDIIVITDADELPTAEAIKGYKIGDGVQGLEMDCYYYDMNTKYVHKWKQSKIAPYGVLKKSNFWDVIYGPVQGIIPNAGRHLCYFGGLERIIKKIEDSAHQELNTDAMKDPERIKQVVKEGKDLFGRSDVKFVKSESIKYNLGGEHKDGFISVDLYSPGADIKWDLEKDWTFAPDNSADFVLASNIFEHLRDKTHTMNELYRILKMGGIAEIFVPSTDGRGAWQDPTHVSYWNVNSWSYWCSNVNYGLTKYNQQCGYKGDFASRATEEHDAGGKVIITRVVLEKVPIQ